MNVDQELELHDAVLHRFSIDATIREVIIEIAIYRKTSDKKRIGARIRFADVKSVTVSGNLDSLKRNSIAGNINYWSVSQDGSPTYIYLADGYIEVVASAIDIDFI
jgi:hypothetical protein